MLDFLGNLVHHHMNCQASHQEVLAVTKAASLRVVALPDHHSNHQASHLASVAESILLLLLLTLIEIAALIKTNSIIILVSI